MPGSDDFFNLGSGIPDLPDKPEHLAAPMFPDMVQNPDIPFGPDADVLERLKMESVRFSKGVKIKEIHVYTFDLSKPDDVEKYKKVQTLMLKLLAQNAIHVTTSEKMAINDSNNPRFIAHMDFVEYCIEKKDHATGVVTVDGVVKNEEPDNGQEQDFDAEYAEEGRLI